jgi:hypothetical protein
VAMLCARHDEKPEKPEKNLPMKFDCKKCELGE